MHYDDASPGAQRKRFSSYYYNYVALGEGCGCAEQVLAHHPRPGWFAALASLVLARVRDRLPRIRRQR